MGTANQTLETETPGQKPLIMRNSCLFFADAWPTHNCSQH